MSRARVPVYNTPNKAVYIETDATKGAEIGVDLYYNGQLVKPEDILNKFGGATTVGSGGPSGATSTSSSAPTAMVTQRSGAPIQPPAGALTFQKNIAQDVSPLGPRQQLIQPELHGTSVGPAGSRNYNYTGSGSSVMTNDGNTVTIGITPFAVASGTNTYTATISPVPTAYIADTTFLIQFTNANTGAATINLNSLGAKAIQLNGAALTSGQIPASSTLTLLYDGAQFQIVGAAPNATVGAVTNVTATAPVASSGGTTPDISMPVATSSADGYLSHTDWAAFNSYKPGRFLGATLLTAASGTFTTSASTNTIVIRGVGGGAGSGGVAGAVGFAAATGGGGAGSPALAVFSVSPSTNYSYTCGAAGSGGAAGANNGTDGANSTFIIGVTTVTANGGKHSAGVTATAAASMNLGGAGGTATTNDLLGGRGESGQAGICVSSTVGFGGNGGSSIFGGGGIGGVFSGSASGYGTGGGGACVANLAANASGAGGKPGCWIVEEYS